MIPAQMMQNFSRGAGRLILAAGLAILSGNMPALAQFEEADQRVQQIFASSYQGICTSLDVDPDNPPVAPDVHDVTFNYRGEDFEPRPYRIYRYHCFNGAYNEIHVYYGADSYEEVRQIFFSFPHFDIDYKNEDYESSRYELDILGFEARDQLVNSYFDPETKTIYAFSKWRGLADASSSGSWEFIEDKFVLTTFDVDASFDGQINAERIYGAGEANNDF